MKTLKVVLVVAVLAACSNFALFSPDAVQIKDAPVPSPTPSPSASATPTPIASPPLAVCSPVVGVNLSGPVAVKIGDVFRVDVTPVSPAGPLEGALDYCNSTRFPSIDSTSANIRCVGSCSGFGPQFLAQGVGPFSVTVRVEGASATFAGTISR